MNTDANSNPPSTRPKLGRQLLQAVPTLLMLGVLAAGWALIHHLTSGGHEPEPEETAEVAPTDTLELPEGKLQAGGFESQPVEPQWIQQAHTVPGRLRYDPQSHIDIKAPLDGMLAELQVNPGDPVVAGQLLAVIRSPEIGQARSEVLRCDQELKLASMNLERLQTLSENLGKLLEMLQRGASEEEIEKAFEKRDLGDYRQELLTAYANQRLAEQWLERVKPLAESGAIPGRTVRERENERLLAETAFRTARDQARFATEKTLLQAAADVHLADQQLKLARQAVEALLGYADVTGDELTGEQALSRLEIRAPIDGTVESRGYSSNERVARGDSLIVLANTRQLTVEASIREGDWDAVDLQPGTVVNVLVPALQNRTFEAQVSYFGRQVETETNAIPLVATIDNQDGLLRPGMFVRVTLPAGERRQALSVKPESVMQHEGREFVFVDLQDGRFQRVDVALGLASADWIEVTAGLSGGQPVVTRGAFLLKSELLLQGEGE